MKSTQTHSQFVKLSLNIFTLLSLVAFSIALNAQDFSKAMQQMNIPVPEKVLMQNARPAVLISISSSGGGSALAGMTAATWGQTQRKIEGEELLAAEAVYEFFKKEIENSFTAAGLKNMLFIDMSKTYLLNSEIEADNSIRKQLYDHQARYIVRVSASSTPSKKDIDKGKAGADDFGMSMISIEPFFGGSVFGFNKGSQEDSYVDMQSNFQATADNFIKKAKERASAQSKSMEGGSYLDKPFHAYQAFTTCPSDLRSAGILMRSCEIMFGCDGVNRKYEKTLSSECTGAFKVAGMTEYGAELASGKYKYALEQKAVPIQKTSVKGNSAGGMGQLKTQMESHIYFIIRDLESSDVYYGGELEKVQNKAVDYLPGALNNLFKRCE